MPDLASLLRDIEGALKPILAHGQGKLEIMVSTDVNAQSLNVDISEGKRTRRKIPVDKTAPRV